MNVIRVLFIGDIVGEPGRDMLKNNLPGIIEKENIGFVVANSENAAHGKGLTKNVSDEIFSYGVNVSTMGNHTFERPEISAIIADPRILRPANYPDEVPGNGYGIYEIPLSGSKIKIAVVNLMGRVFMTPLDDPFRAAERITAEISKATKNIIVDFHAEITSEKQAFGWFLDGRVSAVIGTHTHVQTADARILPSGTAYITDAGMTGPRDGIIGMDRDIIIKKYLTAIPHRFSVAAGPAMLNACVIDIDTDTGASTGIRIIRIEK